jgi:TPR repeat protein
MMSANNNEPNDDTMVCCASCGVAEVDDIKLKKCPTCDLVRYCSDKCQLEHSPQHEAMCKGRVAELRDEILFRQPESIYLGDCPICLLPLPADPRKFSFHACCSKVICNGCYYAHKISILEQRLHRACPFCRHPIPDTDAEIDTLLMKRAMANDPSALRAVGALRDHEEDYEEAFEYYTKAAELGDIEAHYQLSAMYHEGQGVEKDEKKELHHLQEAAIGGHPVARYDLACYEWKNERFDRAVKHLMIAANLGDDDSIKILKQCYAYGDVSKEDFAAALRAHQAAVDAIKSPQREAAEKKRREA